MSMVNRLRGSSTSRTMALVLVVALGGAFIYVRYTQGAAAEANNAAIVMIDRGDYADALSLLEQAIAKNPKQASLHYNRGQALMRLDRFAEARAALEQTLKLNPNHPDAPAALRRVGELERAY